MKCPHHPDWLVSDISTPRDVGKGVTRLICHQCGTVWLKDKDLCDHLPELAWRDDDKAIRYFRCCTCGADLGDAVDDNFDFSVDLSNQPHYTQASIEPIEYIRSQGWLKDFCKGNLIKYITRYPHKGGVEDLRKAKQYLEWLIEAEGESHG